MRVDWKPVWGVLGALLVAWALALLAPMGVGLFYGEPSWWAFGATAALSAAVGGGLFAAFRPKGELRVREGFAIVALAWFLLGAVGALPWVLSGVLAEYTDAYFEVVSGLTTTGATILSGADTPAIADVPNGFLFWRSLTHWLGGMGIIVLALAVLPLLGIGGMQLFKAEVPGPQADKLTPRVRETAKRLWGIYVGLTALQVLLLLPAMSLFDAVNHAFATLATGGFSTENGSVGEYGSAYVEWVVTLFMFLAGMNFALHYGLLRGKTRVLGGEEFRIYLGLSMGATLLLTLALWTPTAPDAAGTDLLTYDGFFEALRYAAFQAVAIITTTGFGTADYELWSSLAMGVLFTLFFVGGMAGSTGGGVKVVRHVILTKNASREMSRLLHPNAVLPLRLDHRVVPPEVIRNVLSFVALYLLALLAGTLALAALGLDLLSAFTAAASAVGNIGPAFGAFGPSETYTAVPVLGKWVLSVLMVAGRLELFTVLMLITPAFWRR